MQGGTTWIHGAYSKTLMDSLKHVKLAGLSNYGCLGLPTFLIFFWISTCIYLIYPYIIQRVSCSVFHGRRINACRSPITMASTSIASGGSTGEWRRYRTRRGRSAIRTCDGTGHLCLKSLIIAWQ